MPKNSKHFRVDLIWVGYGPGNPRPSFWSDDYCLRYGLDVSQEEPFGASAIEAAHRTWHRHEAKVVSVVETDIMGDPIS